MPTLTWYLSEDGPGPSLSDQLLDNRFEVTPKGEATQNALLVSKVGREHFGKWFKCLATNNNVTGVVSSALKLEINRKCFHINNKRSSRRGSGYHFFPCKAIFPLSCSKCYVALQLQFLQCSCGTSKNQENHS